MNATQSAIQATLSGRLTTGSAGAAVPGARTSYYITGFDRPSFVSDITQAVPQDDRCRILGMSFDVQAGVRVTGCLTVDVPDETHRIVLQRQLRAIRGVVSINELNND